MARFRLHIWDTQKKKILMTAIKATQQDFETTSVEPQWQTDWTSDYITSSGFDLYAFKTVAGELVALAPMKSAMVIWAFISSIWRVKRKAI